MQRKPSNLGVDAKPSKRLDGGRISEQSRETSSSFGEESELNDLNEGSVSPSCIDPPSLHLSSFKQNVAAAETQIGRAKLITVEDKENCGMDK